MPTPNADEPRYVDLDDLETWDMSYHSDPATSCGYMIIGIIVLLVAYAAGHLAGKI